MCVRQSCGGGSEADRWFCAAEGDLLGQAGSLRGGDGTVTGRGDGYESWRDATQGEVTVRVSPERMREIEEKKRAFDAARLFDKKEKIARLSRSRGGRHRHGLGLAGYLPGTVLSHVIGGRRTQPTRVQSCRCLAYIQDVHRDGRRLPLPCPPTR